MGGEVVPCFENKPATAIGRSFFLAKDISVTRHDGEILRSSKQKDTPFSRCTRGLRSPSKNHEDLRVAKKSRKPRRKIGSDHFAVTSRPVSTVVYTNFPSYRGWLRHVCRLSSLPWPQQRPKLASLQTLLRSHTMYSCTRPFCRKKGP